MTYTTDELNQTGVYTIINLDTGKRYIGSTVQSFRGRWGIHKSCLRNNKHHSKHLQSSWNKHTEFRFEFRILEFVPPEYCLQREQWWMDLYGSYLPENGYNILPTAGSSLGKVTSEETKQKMRLANKGKTHSEETKQKISLTNKGHTVSEEAKQKLSLINKCKSLSEEHKFRMSASFRPQGYSFIHKETKEVCTFQNLNEFCRVRNLNQGSMSAVANGKRKQHKGWAKFS
jgi:group I intron endonuclease